MNLPGIIAESSLTAANMDQWIGRTELLFQLVSKGGSDGAAAEKTLTDLLKTFGDQATATGGLWSASFKTMIAEAGTLGVGLEQIKALVDGQLQNVASSTASITGGLTGLLAKPGKALDDLLAKWQEFSDSGDVAGVDKINAQITALVHSTVDTYQSEFDRLGRITLASFNAYIANGHTAFEAVTAIGPSIDALTAASDKFGFAGSAAYLQLARWRDLTTQNQPLLDQIGGLNGLMTALQNIGSLDAATFADLQAQGEQAFSQLTAAGFTQTEALSAMAPMLQTIKDLHEQNGLAIDDTTQALINQATEQGILKEKQESTQDVLIEGFSALLKALGVDLPEAWKKFTKAGQDASKDVSKALEDIPSPTIRINYDNSGYPGGQAGAGSGIDPNDPYGYQQGFKWGTPNLDYANFAGAGQSIIAHGQEAIIPRGSGHQLAAEIADAMGGVFGPGPITVAPKIYIGNREIRDYIVDSNIRAIEDNASSGAPKGIKTRYKEALAT